MGEANWDEPTGDQLEILDPENYRNPEESKFNHQSLVMIAMKKCLEYGSKELREGWWETKTDRMGNTSKTYNTDTRKEFIEAVKSLMMITECDYFNIVTGQPIKPMVEIYSKLENLKKQLIVRKQYWLDEEWKWWCALNQSQQQQARLQGKGVSQGYFNANLYFDNYFFEEELNIYRSICTILNHMTKELHYYGTEGFSA